MQNIPKCLQCNRNYSFKDTKRHGNVAACLPLLLTCGHTYCTECLTKLSKVQKSAISCPSCQQATSLATDGAVKSLPPDIYITGLLAAYHSSPPPLQLQMIEFSKSAGSKKPKSKEEMCEECAHAPATCRCTRCQGNMCGSCFSRIHSASNMLRQHQAMPLERMQAANGPNYSDAVMPVTCETHGGRAIEYYCETDQVPICSQCALLGDHQGHKITTCDEKNAVALTELGGVVNVALAALKQSKLSYQLMHAMLTSVRSNARTVVEDIQLGFQRLHSILQARELVLCEEVLYQSQEQLAPVEETQGNLSEHMKKLETAISESRSVLANSRAAAAQRCLHRLKHLIDVPCHAEKTELTEPLRCCLDVESLAREFQLYGSVQGSAVGSVQMKCIHELDDAAKLVADAVQMKPIVASPPHPPAAAAATAAASLPRSINGSTLPSLCGSTDAETLSVSSEASNSSMPSSSAAAPRQYELPRRRPVSKTVLNKGGRPKKHHTEPAFVTHIRSPCHFVVQLNRNIDRLTELSHAINTHCKTSTGKNDVPPRVDPDDLVLAMFSNDKKWYRGRVLKVTETSSLPDVEVLYIDYGNVETISLTNTRTMQPRFLRDPELSMLCSLVDIVPAGSTPDRAAVWSKEAVDAFASMIGNKAILLTVIHETETITFVDLSRPASTDVEDDGPVSVRDALVFLDLAHFASPHSLPRSVSWGSRRRYLPPELPKPKKLVDVRVCHVNSPDDFYIQMMCPDAHYLLELMNNLQSTYGDSRGDQYTVYYPVKGMMCAVRFSADQLFYRAEILNIVDANYIEVKYVDYGNVEAVSVQRIRKLLDIYTVLTVQAVHCVLADVAAASWPLPSMELMHKLMTSEVELKMLVNEIGNDRTMSVFIQDPSKDHSVNSLMVMSGWAEATGRGWNMSLRSESSKITSANMPASLSSRTDNLRSGSSDRAVSGATAASNEDSAVMGGKPFGAEVQVCHVETPSKFYVLELSRKDALTVLMEQLQSCVAVEDQNIDAVWQPGSECAVCKDHYWYRAVISEVIGDTYKVALVDYGTEARVSEKDLWLLPSSCASTPGFALRCHLDSIVPAGDITRWSQTACETLQKKLTIPAACFLVPKGPAVNGSLPVDLLIEEVVIGGALSPNSFKYVGVTGVLKDKGLALPKRQTSGFEVPPCVLSQSDPNRRIGLCTLVFGTDSASADAAQPADPAASSSHPTNIAASATSPVSTTSSSSRPSQPLVESHEEAATESASIPAAVCPGYPPIADDFPPADLRADTSKFRIVITHVDEDCHIYGHALSEDKEAMPMLVDIMNDIQEEYVNSKPEDGRLWFEGQIAVSQFTDDNLFYRARVLNVIDADTVEVFYVDFGNMEIVPTTRLRADPICVDKPAQALNCVLSGIRWLSDDGKSPPAAVTLLTNVLLNQQCTAQVQQREMVNDNTIVFHVELILPGERNVVELLRDEGYVELHQPVILPGEQNLVQLLRDEEYVEVDQSEPQLSVADDDDGSTVGEASVADASASLGILIPRSPLSEAPECNARLSAKRLVESPYKMMPLPTKDGSVIGIITQVDLPNMVYLQHIKLEDAGDTDINVQLDRLLQLSDFYASSWQELLNVPPDNIVRGLQCVAQCTLDSCWYRAEILDVRRNDDLMEMSIIFVDYGSSDYIVDASKIREMPVEHMDLPAQAMACIISGLEPADIEFGWNPSDGALLAEIATNKVLHAVVKGVVDGMVEVDLYDRQLYLQHGASTPLLYQPLVERGCMKLNRRDQDSAGKEPSTNEDRLSVEEDGGGDVDTARSWAERVELSDPEN